MTDTAAETDTQFGVPLRGVEVDAQTRCLHYGTDRDVIAIQFPCCEVYYPCFACHAAVTEHTARQWPTDRFDESAVFCGVCRTPLSITAYLESDNACPACDAAFNPGCQDHHDRYFAR
ncbi:MAG: hypothetical protein J07HX5_00120 [halophilic archaeon J07HX5]|jgi:Uncharacterized conserved protein|nr:MAG: hypothetical protein J07HX5_00120 [halophilic archaeon J07HX5]